MPFRGSKTDVKETICNLNVQLLWVVLLFSPKRGISVSKYNNYYDYFCWCPGLSHWAVWLNLMAKQRKALEAHAMTSPVAIVVETHSHLGREKKMKNKKQILCFLNSNEHLHFYYIKIMVPALIQHVYFFIY